MNQGRKYNFDDLVKIMSQLRSKTGGCIWDRKQTHQSLLKYLREESREFAQEVKTNNYKNMSEELGDILLQIVFHAQIAKEEKKFDIDDVVDTICRKLIRRHPHVFAGRKIKSVKELIRVWNEIKAGEKADKA